MRITSVADRVAGTRPAGRRTARRSRKPSPQRVERRVLEAPRRRPAAGPAAPPRCPAGAAAAGARRAGCAPGRRSPSRPAAPRASIVEDDQPRVVAGVEDRQAADDLQEGRDAEHHGEPEDAEQRDGDPLRPWAAARAPPRPASAAARPRRARARAGTAGSGSASAGPTSRAGRARSPPRASSAMSTDVPAAVAEVGRVQQQLARTGSRLTAASAAPPAMAAAEGEHRAPQRRRARHALAARLPEPQDEEGRRRQQRVEARLGMAGQELERHDGGQPGAGEQARPAHEPVGQQAAATG